MFKFWKQLNLKKYSMFQPGEEHNTPCLEVSKTIYNLCMLVLNILVRIVINRQLQIKISRNTYNLYMLVLNILVRIVATRQLQSKISRNTYNRIRYSCPNCSCQPTTTRGLKTQPVHDCVFNILVVIVITRQLKREIWGSTYKLYIILSNTLV